MSPRQNPALRATRRWTAGALMAAALVTGGVGVHLADKSTAATVAVGSTSVSSTTRPGSTSGTTSDATGSGSGFGTIGSVGSGSGSVSTTTSGS
ncbi:MAG: hypothetical protein M3Y71_12495 [Actinomycetota bacterium]|nr:hypothetical protein [Actinomycetota bacterium]